METNGPPGVSGSSSEPKRKTASNSLLTLKFMQKGQDAELSSRLRQQRLKEISEQQWRLSVIDDSAAKSGGSSAKGVSYEPSYSAFESRPATKMTKNGEQILNRGRKTISDFEGNIKEFLESARAASSTREEDLRVRSATRNPLKRTKDAKDPGPAKKKKRREPKA